MLRLFVIAQLMALALTTAAQAAPSSGSNAAHLKTVDRTLSMYNIHTKETVTVTYRKAGKLVPEAMKQLNWILRDWRTNQTTKMDPKTIDLVWEMHQELGSQEPVHIISGYRSPKTNAMLRKKRGGQARKSQHMVGRAIDVSFPDVPVRRMRYSAMIRERGGVGYYPASGVPFVHVDSARVRHWPRMLRDELALIFPDGKTKHRPRGGKPITKADVKRAKTRKKKLAADVAQFFAERRVPGSSTTMFAKKETPPTNTSTWQTATLIAPPREAIRPVKFETPVKPTPAAQPKAKPQPRIQVASLTGLPLASVPKPTPVTAPPKRAPRIPSFTKPIDGAEKQRLDQLITLARLVEGPRPAKPPVTSPIETAALPTAANPTQPVDDTAPHFDPIAALLSETEDEQSNLGHMLQPPTPRLAWVSSPDFDEDHPDEENYRRFAIAPLVTETASIDDPSLAILQHPDSEATFALIAEEDASVPLSFGPRTSELLRAAQTFSSPRGSARRSRKETLQKRRVTTTVR